MKTKSVLVLGILVMHLCMFAQVKIGNNPTSVNSASLLELETTNQGFVLPRVAIGNVSSSLPLASGLLTGTIVYNISSTTTGGSGAGIYLWDGTKWIAVNTGPGISSSAWLLNGNSGTNYASNFLGTTDNASLRLRTNNTERMIVDSLGSVGIGSSAFDHINKEKLLVDFGATASNTIAGFTGSTDNYFQINLQNKSGTGNASSDYVATADDGTDSTYYVDMGINSSNYAFSLDNWGQAHDAYLYSNSKNLLIGTQVPGSDVIFLVGGGRAVTNSALRIRGNTGNVVIGKGDVSATPVGNILRGPNGLGNNIAGGNLTIQGGAGTGAASAGNLSLNGGITGTGANGIINLSTSGNERMRVDSGGNIGIGTAYPPYKLSVLAASNPLYLAGLQATSTFSSDSILTINAGVVKKTPYSSLSTIPSTGWLLTGNSGTTPSTNFLGTTDNQSLVFKANNQLSGKIDLTTNNLSLGYQSANSSPTGTNNTFLGYQSGYANTSGGANTGVGGIALNANTTGSNNSALGMGALGNNTTGSNNTSVGAGALRNNTTAASNVAVGASALRANTTGGGNTAVGTYSMQVNTTGYSNSAIGSGALGANTTGTGNTAAGNSSLGGNILGINNTAVGNGTMQLNDQGNSNTAVGAFAMQNSNGSGGNTAVGYTTLNNISTGTNNTALGSSAGITNTTGTNNTLLGYQADVNINNLTNATALGYNAQVSASNSLVLGNGANIGIGTSFPGYKLHVVATTNPLYLGGVQTTSTFSSDSILTINKGVVKLAPYAALPTAFGGGWALTGNSGTSAGTNFLGTTDNQSLVFKVNNLQSGKIDLPLNNSSFGYLSANNITTGTNNTFLGYQSGNSNTSGASNTGVGSNALKSNTTALANTAMGNSALTLNTTGSDNTANGNNALSANSTGYRNTANGSNTMLANTTGAENSANGALVLYSNISGNQNTAAGNTALYSNTTGNSNTATGFQSLYNNTTGYYNTGYGYKSLYTNTTGTNNTALGYGADVSTASLSNATAIGYNTVVSASNSLVLGNNANVGIGTSTPNNKLEVNSGTGGASGLRLTQLPAGGVLFMSGSADVSQNNSNLYFDVTNYRLGIAAGTSPNSTLQVNGSVASGITTKTANYTASASDYTILCNNTSAITIYIPNASGTSGRMYVFKKISSAAATVTIQTAISGQTIDGAATYLLSSQYSFITVQSDGSNWYIISKG